MRLNYPNPDNLSSLKSRKGINQPFGEDELAIPETLGQRLARAKRKRSVSNQELAKVAGVHANTVSKWLSDVQRPDAEALDALARRLSVSSTWLLHGDSAADLSAEEAAGLSVGDASRLSPEFTPLPTPNAVRESDELASYFRSDFSPNPALRKRLRPKPYQRVYEHVAKMESAGCSIEQIEEAERVMIDGAYNKLNKRDARERTDAEMIMDIDAAWAFIKEVLEREGVKGLS